MLCIMSEAIYSRFDNFITNRFQIMYERFVNISLRKFKEESNKSTTA